MAKTKEHQSHLLPVPRAEKESHPLATYLGNKPFISAQSWAIYDCKRGKLIAGKNDMVKREVASITKMMTFYTAI